MKTEVRLNQRNRRKIRETAKLLVVEYAPYIMKMSKTPIKEIKICKQILYIQPRNLLWSYDKRNTYSPKISSQQMSVQD